MEKKPCIPGQNGPSLVDSSNQGVVMAIILSKRGWRLWKGVRTRQAVVTCKKRESQKDQKENNGLTPWTLHLQANVVDLNERGVLGLPSCGASKGRGGRRWQSSKRDGSCLLMCVCYGRAGSDLGSWVMMGHVTINIILKLILSLSPSPSSNVADLLLGSMKHLRLSKHHYASTFRLHARRVSRNSPLLLSRGSSRRFVA
jgi:hypothetical protein